MLPSVDGTKDIVPKTFVNSEKIQATQQNDSNFSIGSLFRFIQMSDPIISEKQIPSQIKCFIVYIVTPKIDMYISPPL